MQWKINLTRWFDHKGENLCSQKSHRVNFKSLLRKNPLIKKQAVISIKNLTPLAYPKIPTYYWIYWPLLVYQLQYLIGLILVETSPCTDPSMWLTTQKLGCSCYLMQSYLVYACRSRGSLVHNPKAHKKSQQLL